jgi:DNA primase
MRDGAGSIVGIRLRADDGRKWAVKGSHQGIFIPSVQAQPIVYVTEGPTDTAAALTIGLYAIGRPSCNSGGQELKTACKRLGIRKAVLVADNDEPGIKGASKIASELGLPTCIYVPPAKDLREFVKLGGTKIMIESELKNTVWKAK